MSVRNWRQDVGSTYLDEGRDGKELGIVVLISERLMNVREGSVKGAAARDGVKK